MSSIVQTHSIDVVVTEATSLTGEIRLLRLCADNGVPLPAFEPGAHVMVEAAPGVTRAYSLCSDPADRSHYDIAVKLEVQGRGGSRALHALTAGARLVIGAPRNLFALAPSATHHLLIGGGIGATPLVAMAHQLARDGAPFTFVQFSRSDAHLPFARLLREGPWHSQVALHFDDVQTIDLARLSAALPPGTHAYCCGPSAFVRWARAQCANVGDAQWHEERFSADASDDARADAESPAAIRLILARSAKQITMQRGQTLLDALRGHGVSVDTACEQGVCGSCVVEYSDGEPVHGDACLDATERERYVALCCGGCCSESLTLQL
ncbi:TPA: oxidoreductase [Burkholderia multivorans]|uniref:Putative dioxygenase subunit beta YeaX n=1 Tax=Burkholderia multivorans CGD2 TaxID=513052 RepID=B9BP35_9BURK|nr:PDR/VanB family oxidoreductase [Burkholderia multivorans]EEE07353.1 putative dioxygenase subunit beta YeaX [Burkholderia multivorans CGD2]EEE13724.1 putative dioxygenase subunit beta YeaX [Burkholderia multivorans CGD2M]PRH21104.1 oxidoreductase [Burkholderia multivorans]HEM7842891.1 oxidoreductase [Burkholderia multivorans]HEM7872731.1 oxidoreductase [Burkholderia multivorans]